VDTLQGDPVSKTPEQQLEEYEMMVEQIKDALYMLDSEGRYLLVNGAYEDLTGCSRDELIGSTMSIVLDSDAMAERRELTLELLKRGSERRGHAWQSTLHTADKTQLPVEVNFATLEYNGEFIGIVGSARDISDRRRREQELSVLSRVLRHNLGNKVNIIQGYAEVIGDHIADENALDYTERIRRTAGKLIQQSGKARDIHDLLQEWPPAAPPGRDDGHLGCRDGTGDGVPRCDFLGGHARLHLGTALGPVPDGRQGVTPERGRPRREGGADRPCRGRHAQRGDRGHHHRRRRRRAWDTGT
jgi:PAS domain S-box-containing protein